MGTRSTRDFTLGPADPREAAVRALVETHLALNLLMSPPEDAHALEVEELLVPTVALFAARAGDVVLGVGALKEIGAGEGKLKTMHTAEWARGRGVGRAMLDHLLDQARRRGFRRVSLETGTIDDFAPARALYLSVGFTPCAPFGEYRESRNSVYLSLDLTD